MQARFGFPNLPEIHEDRAFGAVGEAPGRAGFIAYRELEYPSNRRHGETLYGLR